MEIVLELDAENYPRLSGNPNAANMILEYLRRNEIPVTEANAYSQASMLEIELEMMFS